MKMEKARYGVNMTQEEIDKEIEFDEEWERQQKKIKGEKSC